MRRHCGRSRAVLRLALAAFAAGFFATAAGAADATVFAAASLVDVLGNLASAFETSSHLEITVVSGASSTMARQIEAGAPADLFISANRANAEQVAALNGAAMQSLFGNELVIIAPAGYTGKIALDELPGKLGDGRLAVGDPEHVPAGIYARQAMEAAGVWLQLKDRLAPAGDVRAALAYVVQGLAPFGIVYATDALADGVRIAGRIDGGLHAPINYWGVEVHSGNKTAAAFLEFIRSDAGGKILAAAGFKTGEQGQAQHP